MAIYRLLVRAGPAGLAAGEIAAALGMRPQTLTHHLGPLARSGLLTRRRDGRQRIYAIRGEGLQELLGYLGDDCCQGRRALLDVGAETRFERLRDSQTRPTVLFLCSGNAARSPMAEALLRWNAGRRFDVYSAGVRPVGLHPMARRVLEELDVPTTGLASKDLGSLLGRVGVDHAIVLCDEAEEDCASIVPFARVRTYWPIDDPVLPGASESALLAAFRGARDELDERIRAWLRGGLHHDDGAGDVPPRRSV